MQPMLAKTYDGQAVNGWLMSEKLDGCRAIWTGSELISRNGNRFAAPQWLTDQLPAGVVLDGELYVGRNAFEAVVGIVRKKIPVDAEWQRLRYCVFDAPERGGGFEDRIAYCASILSGCAVAEVVEQTVCRSARHLREFFARLVAQGAEGIMLRRPGSGYESRRSDNLLKYKPQDTAEAEVIGHQPGEGRHIGRIGALICRVGDVIFNVGTGFTDALRATPPPVGAVVTFAYQGTTAGGVPRFPVFVAARDYE